jgi:urease accessory protein
MAAIFSLIAQASPSSARAVGGQTGDELASMAAVIRATSILRAGEFDDARAVDRVALDAGDRHRRRLVLTGERGTTFLLDLAHATPLRDGDGLVLEDGAIVRIAGLAEPLLEIAAENPCDLARLAWHLGNRHTEIQVKDGKLRIRRDHVLEDIVRRLGATVTLIDAPFDPEGGSHADHEHGHDHRHGAHGA